MIDKGRLLSLTAPYLGSARTTLRKHQLLSNGYHVLLSGMSTHALPSNGRPIVAHSLLWYVFTGLLPSSGRPSVVGCASVGTCLPIRFLETDQSVTISYLLLCWQSSSHNYWIHNRMQFIKFNSKNPELLRGGRSSFLHWPNKFRRSQISKRHIWCVAYKWLKVILVEKSVEIQRGIIYFVFSTFIPLFFLLYDLHTFIAFPPFSVLTLNLVMYSFISMELSSV
jgi:hypothetical protein